MAGLPVDEGAGGSLKFSSTSYTCEIVSITPSGQKRAALDTTHLASTAKTYMPGDLIDPGTLEVVIHYPPDTPPPFTAAENFILYFPKSGTQTTGASLTALGFISERSGPAVKVDEIMEQTITVQLSGVVSTAAGT